MNRHHNQPNRKELPPMATMDEQETTVTQLRNQETRIYTANPVLMFGLMVTPVVLLVIGYVAVEIIKALG